MCCGHFIGMNITKGIFGLIIDFIINWSLVYRSTDKVSQKM